MRLHGVGGDFSNMLVEVGVTSCMKLQHCIPEKLHTQLEKISPDKQIGHRVPTLAQMTQWIIEARSLWARSPVNGAVPFLSISLFQHYWYSMSSLGRIRNKSSTSDRL
jgi:uncharacterized protein DUF4332